MKRVFRNQRGTMFIVDETEHLFSQSPLHEYLFSGNADKCDGYCDGYFDALKIPFEQRIIRYKFE